MLKRRRPAPIPRPDLTPFVSVALLLIVFFVWLKQLQRPNATTVYVPDGPCHKTFFDGNPMHSDAVLFLLANNHIDVLRFIPETHTAEINEITYTASNFRRLIQALKPSDRRLTLIIKPTKQATFGTMVGILNELQRANKLPFILSNYMLPAESQLLARYATFKANSIVSRSSELVKMSLYDGAYSSFPFLTPALPL